MLELADKQDLGSCGISRVGSSPTRRMAEVPRRQVRIAHLNGAQNVPKGTFCTRRMAEVSRRQMRMAHLNGAQNVNEPTRT